MKMKNKSKCDDGNSFIDGAINNQVVSFAGERSEYVITRWGDGSYTVRDLKKCRNSEDTLINVDSLYFNNSRYKVSSLVPDRYVKKRENLANGPFQIAVDASLLIKGCTKGQFEDCHRLGSIYANGFAGVKRSYDKAADNYVMACHNGLLNSCSSAANAFLNTKNSNHKKQVEDMFNRACTLGDFTRL
ncbi:MAG: SEL1-like repeat protein [Bdellovibrionales bacterium]|nr:SEL1-like repeat protein [Bdellovibrionales bacterium]